MFVLLRKKGDRATGDLVAQYLLCAYSTGYSSASVMVYAFAKLDGVATAAASWPIR